MDRTSEVVLCRKCDPKHLMKLSTFEWISGSIIFILLFGAALVYSQVNKAYCGDGSCQNGEQKNCFADCEWCGDNICQSTEIKVCSQDCDWCGDNYCQSDESCSSCSKDCGTCETQSYCGDGICNSGECQLGCAKDCNSIDCQNGICEKELGETCINTPNDCGCGISSSCNPNTGICESITCGNGVCDGNENPLSCSEDCKTAYVPIALDSTSNIPVLLIHGHSANEQDTIDYSNINTFFNFQNKLEVDGYVNKGILLASAKESAVEFGAWGKLGKTVVVRTTYYLGVYDDRGTVIGTEDEKAITVYADRIKQVIERLQQYTGKNKVIIIAHSMGGLVAREYIRKYGGDNVAMLITIGTPNHGIYGTLSNLCSIGHEGPECTDMAAGSPFLTQLNKDETPGNTQYITLEGNCCADGSYFTDEVVRVNSVSLNGANNLVIPGKEVPGPYLTFHSDLTNPSKVPEVYSAILKELQNSVN